MKSEALSCACGAVTGSATATSDISGVCHCVMCRKWSGGAFMGVSCKNVSFDNPDAVSIWISSDWGERLFCATCGSTLLWRMRDGSHTSVSAHLFDDPSRFPMRSEIFIDDKPSGYNFAGDHERLTRAEVMAKFESKEGEA